MLLENWKKSSSDSVMVMDKTIGIPWEMPKHLIPQQGFRREILFYYFVCLFLAVVSLHRCAGFSLVTVSRSYSWLQCMGFSLRCFSCCGAPALGFTDLTVWFLGFRELVVVHRFSWFMACQIILDQGSNSCPLHWLVDS